MFQSTKDGVEAAGNSIDPGPELFVGFDKGRSGKSRQFPYGDHPRCRPDTCAAERVDG